MKPQEKGGNRGHPLEGRHAMEHLSTIGVPVLCVPASNQSGLVWFGWVGVQMGSAKADLADFLPWWCNWVVLVGVLFLCFAPLCWFVLCVFFGGV